MYNKIKNPLTGRKVDIRSNLGKKIIKAYLSPSNVQNGGISFKNRTARYLKHIGTSEGENENIACPSCSMSSLGMPVNIVNFMTYQQKTRTEADWNACSSSYIDINGILNDINETRDPELESKIYIWGKGTVPTDPYVKELKVYDFSLIKKNVNGIKYNIQFPEYEFEPFFIPGDTWTERERGDGLGERALMNIFENLKNGSSTLLAFEWADRIGTEQSGAGHVVVISKSYKGNPYLIDSQQPSWRDKKQGYYRGWNKIIKYFNNSSLPSFFITFNNSPWERSSLDDWKLKFPEYELNIDIDVVFPQTYLSVSQMPNYLDESKNTDHPSRNVSYLNEREDPNHMMELWHDIPESELLQLDQSRENTPGTRVGPIIEEIE